MKTIVKTLICLIAYIIMMKMSIEAFVTIGPITGIVGFVICTTAIIYVILRLRAKY